MWQQYRSASGANRRRSTPRLRLFSAFLALCLLISLLPTAAYRALAQETEPRAELIGYAVLAADTFAVGPASGQFNGDGSKAALPRFPAQPVQGFSGVQFGPTCGSYFVLSDNGYGSKYNSIDYLLRIYAITPDPLTAEGGSGDIAVDSFIQLSDPAHLVPFFIAREFSTDRYLTGFDFDVIVAAGSTGFMAQAASDGPFNLLRPGDRASAAYPTVRRDSEGMPVLVVNSDQLYRYVGHLLVGFDADGHVLVVDKRSGPVATTTEAIEQLGELLGKEVAAPEAVTDLFANLSATPLIEDLFAVVGTTESELNGQRSEVRSRETNLGRLAADSTLWYARQAFPDLEIDAALKNGGGIRATILGPAISKLTIGAALAFDNRLAVVELTGGELLAVMENAVSRVPALDGRFPQIAGMTLAYDASREGISDQLTLDSPSRVRSLVISRADGSEDVLVEGFALQGDPNRTFTLATNDFLLTGGDGYQALKAAAESRGAQRPELGEQEVLATYVETALAGEVTLTEPLAEPRITRLD